MIKITAIMMAALLAATVQAAHAASPIPPEVTTAVDLSSSDINRIVCPGTINDLIFSREKGLEGHFVGNNAFVKFTIMVQGDEKSYSTTPTELFVSCNDTIYSLIATPKRIPAVTLRLSPPVTGDFKQNLSRYQALPLERKVLQLVREAYLGEYPDSYRVRDADAVVAVSVDLFVRLVRIVDVEGVGLRLKEYQVKATADEAIRVTEKDFLRAKMGEGIIAVVVEITGSSGAGRHGSSSSNKGERIREPERSFQRFEPASKKNLPLGPGRNRHSARHHCRLQDQPGSRIRETGPP